MLIMLVTDGAQYADYLLDNPLILEGSEMEMTIYHIACMLSKATKRKRSLAWTFVNSLTETPAERAKMEKARKRAEKRMAKCQEST